MAKNQDLTNKIAGLEKATQQIIPSKLKSTFAQTARETVLYFYGRGGTNVGQINRLIQISVNTKGINTTKFVAWLKILIPHKLVRDADGIPVFTRRLKEYDKLFVYDFVAKYPDYFDYDTTAEEETLDSVERKKLIKYCKGISSIQIGVGDTLSRSEIKSIIKAKEKLAQMINSYQILNDTSIGSGNTVSARIINGGLPSLGKKR